MSLEQPDPNQSAVEAVLASLVPAEWNIDRDRLLYSAGEQAARANWRSIRRLLFATTAGSILVSAVLVGVLLSGPQIERVEHAANPVVDAEKIVEPDPDDEPVEVADAPPNFMHGFSPILNVDHWDVDRLRKAGITIQHWTHKVPVESTPPEWVQVAFDCSKLPREQDVLMTARFALPGQSQPIAIRSARDATHPGSVSIFFSSPELPAENGMVEIYIWRPNAKGGGEAGGYRLSKKRIFELAREQTANKPTVQ